MTLTKKLFSIRTSILSLFIFASVLTGSITIGLDYYLNQKTNSESVIQKYNGTINHINHFIALTDEKAASYTRLLTHFNHLLVGQYLPIDAVHLFANIMNENPHYQSIYVAFPDGSFQKLVNVNAIDTAPETLQTIPSDRWVFITTRKQQNQTIRQFFYLDSKFNLRTQRQEITNFDATTQQWYKNAQALTVTKSIPYQLPLSLTLGQTYSLKTPDADIVIGLDVDLKHFVNNVQDHLNTALEPTVEQVYLLTENGETLASYPAVSSTNKTQTPLGISPNSQIINLLEAPEQQNKLTPLIIDGMPYYAYVVKTDAHNENTLFLAVIIKQDTLLLTSLEQIKTSAFISIICLILCLPLLWLLTSSIIKPISALTLQAEKIKNRNNDQTSPINSRLFELKTLSHSMHEMNQSIVTYQSEQRELLHSFVRLLAQSSDNNSHTENHSHRLPELASMLLKAAEISEDTYFKSFKLTKDEHDAFQISAWLHHWEKRNIPEHLINKGSKLESVYNRIHEIRMRFEVLWRDTELNFYKQSLEKPEQTKPLKESMIKQQLQLMRDFEFVANVNIGKTEMSPEAIQRLQTISEQTWLRYFDDRLGLSPAETYKLIGKKLKLPVKEQLISDKNSQIMKRQQSKAFDPKLASQVTAPVNLYHQGELYNLLIQKGTLTLEEKFNIRQQATHTLNRLKGLPFPQDLDDVAYYISTLHKASSKDNEQDNIKKTALSISVQILNMADLFKTLTTSDKPYKKPYTLSEAINILHKLALKKHVDIAVFKLFLSSGVYLEYAHKYLNEAQIDDIDIKQYLN